MLVEGVWLNAFARACAPEPSLDVSTFSAAEQILSALAFVGSSAPSRQIPKRRGRGSRSFDPGRAQETRSA